MTTFLQTSAPARRSLPLVLLPSAVSVAVLTGCGGEGPDTAPEAAGSNQEGIADAASAESVYQASAGENVPGCGSAADNGRVRTALAKAMPDWLREIIGWERDRTIDFRARVHERQEKVDGLREMLDNATMTQEERAMMERALVDEIRLLRRAQKYLADPRLLRRAQPDIDNSITGSTASEDSITTEEDIVSTGPVISMRTSLGDLQIELFSDDAPETAAKFLRYVEDGFYDCTIFHRVVRGFVIQGGGFTAEMEEKDTRPPIRNEATNGLRNRRGTVAMARTGDPHSASAQFFVNTKDNAMLDHTGQDQRGWGYTVFGRVITGMETVDLIDSSAVVSRNGHDDVPYTPVFIKSAAVVTR